MQNDNKQPQNHPLTPGYDPSSIYPTAGQAPQTTAGNPQDYAPVGTTGSQIQEQKVPMPIGVYIIAGFNLLGFGVSFFDTSQNSVIYSIAMFVDLLLAIGLLLRLEAARKIMLWLTGLTLVISVVSLLLLVALQQRIRTLKTDYDTAVSQIDQRRLTPAQKQQLDAAKATIADNEKEAGKAITFSYVKLGVTSVETIVVAVYLTRPKIKGVFHELEN